MFPSRYFADRYFAARYWAKVGAEAALVQATRRTGILIGSDRHLHIEGSNRREQLDGTARRGELKQ